MNRTRVLIIVSLLLVIVGVVIALALVNQSRVTVTVTTAGDTNVAQQGTPVAQAAATALPTVTPVPYVEVVIAIQDIPRGTRVAANAVTIVLWPEEAAPVAGYSNIEDVLGKIARTDIYREQPILSNILVDDFQSLATVGSDAAAIIPPNRVAVAIPIDRLTSVAYAIRPGDRVDIITSLLFVDVDQTFQTIEPNQFNLVNLVLGEVDPRTGTQPRTLQIDPLTIRGAFDSRVLPGGFVTPILISPSEQPRPRLAAQRTVQDAVVIWLGDFPLDGRIFRPAPTPTIPVPTNTPAPNQQGQQQAEPAPTATPARPDIITLAVSPQDAVVLTWMVEAGLPLTFALRSAQTSSLPLTDSVTLDYIMTRFNILLPEKFNYSIEPAIRSIRQIEIGNRIQLRQ